MLNQCRIFIFFEHEFNYHKTRDSVENDKRSQLLKNECIESTLYLLCMHKLYESLHKVVVCINPIGNQFVVFMIKYYLYEMFRGFQININFSFDIMNFESTLKDFCLVIPCSLNFVSISFNRTLRRKREEDEDLRML